MTKRCIIADDVRSARELLAAWMAEIGYHCALVPDGDEAIRQLNIGSVELIISDIEMPKCNGLQLLAWIRSQSDAKYQSLPVIMVSSLDDSKMFEVVKNFGANGAICKPFDRLQIHKMVSAIETGASWVQCEPNQLSGAPLPAVSPKLRRMADALRDLQDR